MIKFHIWLQMLHYNLCSKKAWIIVIGHSYTLFTQVVILFHSLPKKPFCPHQLHIWLTPLHLLNNLLYPRLQVSNLYYTNQFIGNCIRRPCRRVAWTTPMTSLMFIYSPSTFNQCLGRGSLQSLVVKFQSPNQKRSCKI